MKCKQKLGHNPFDKVQINVRLLNHPMIFQVLPSDYNFPQTFTVVEWMMLKLQFTEEFQSMFIVLNLC